MAEILLKEAGSAVGRRALPQGINILGRQIAGAQIGRSLGRYAGAAIDEALFATPREGPRLTELHVMESREGAGIPNVYGRMRVGGQVIWAGGFKETRTEEGGKGGPQYVGFSYSASFAVAICEGPGVRVERVWANSEPLSLGRLQYRIYPGSETQEPDPIIEAIEGVAPAYRGLAYIVFEDLDLEPFGSRLPQLSFEVTRTPTGGTGTSPAENIRSVNIIPATGEFVYATQPIRERTFPGRERALNVNTSVGEPDMLVSLDQMQSDLPNMNAVSLTCGWFGSDLRAEACEIRPGVETLERTTVPRDWRGGAVSREHAYLVSQTEDGHANYGGTPADWSVIDAIAELKSRGIEVTFTPFLLMDIPPGNALPDVGGGVGQPVHPWRGRIFSDTDGTAAATETIDAFMGTASASNFHVDSDQINYTGDSSDWGYRRFILHNAMLAKAAGGVSAFLIGSEMRDLTRLRDDQNAFPFVDALCALSDEVKAILGPLCAVSYAADWTEYGAFVPGDGSNNIFFPLDALWARPSIDFVGIDWYPPAGDWRSETDHLDRLAGYEGPDDPAYLAANMEGGEAFDWYYANADARRSQARTPIDDTAYGEDWVFRAKDVRGWWQSVHEPRLGGVKTGASTLWVPESKPVRFCEIGFPAVDKGINSPNLFHDPKSSESAFPPFSTGERDDVLQAAALDTALGHWQGTGFVEAASVWAWDARPFPAFPARGDVWSDSANWSFGHWLNGRMGATQIERVVEDLADRAGVELETQPLQGLVEGFALSGVSTLSNALAPLMTAFELSCFERDGEIVIAQPHIAAPVQLPLSAIVEGGLEQLRDAQTALHGVLQLQFADLAHDFQIALSEARHPGGDPRRVVSVWLPLAFAAPEAKRLASSLLDKRTAAETTSVVFSSFEGMPDITQPVKLEGASGLWTVETLETHLETALTLRPIRQGALPSRTISVPGAPSPTPSQAGADLLAIDAPWIAGVSEGSSATLAVFSDPWRANLPIYAGPEVGALWAVHRGAARPALTGILRSPLGSGPVHRWDVANSFIVEFAEARVGALSDAAVLAGRNRLLVETVDGWELCSFARVEHLGGATYRLSRLLRGQNGSEAACEAGAVAGGRCVLVDDALLAIDESQDAIGAPQLLRAGHDGETVSLVFQNRAAWPWRPAHLRWSPARDLLEWSPRGPSIPSSWDAPEGVMRETYEIAWEFASAAPQIETASTSQIAVPADIIGARVRGVAVSGSTSEWVSIDTPTS